MTSHKIVAKAAGLMMVAILASRLLGLVREMLIARQFGQGGLVSAYTNAFNLPDLLYFFLSSGALSSAFIPVFTERFQTGRQKEAWQIFSIIACFMGLVLMIAVALSEVFAAPLVKALAVPGFVKEHPELVPQTVALTRIILPSQLFFFFGGLMMGTLESRQKFTARAAGPVIYNLGIIFGVVVLSRWFSIQGLAWGAMIGAFAGNIGYTFYTLKRAGFEFHPSLNLRHPGVVRVAQLALPVILGLSLPQIDVIINKWFASFVSESAPAALNYANRLMQVPLGIFAQAAGTAILPTLSAYAARNAIGDLRSGVSFGLRAILALNIPATVFMVVMADPLVRMVYMSGQFTSASVPAATIALVFYSAGIFAWAGQAIVARGFFAMQDTITPIVLGTISTVLFIPLNYGLMRVMGHGGLALATTIAAVFHLMLLTFFLRRRLDGLEGRRVMKSLGRVCLAAAVMGVVCYGVRLQMANVAGTWQIQDGDIRSPGALATTLHSSRTPLSSYLYSELAPATQAMIRKHEQAERISPLLRRALAEELNGLLLGPSIYSRKRFEDVELSKETRRLIRENASGGRAGMRLNRLLLEQAYPAGIVTSRRDGPWSVGERDVEKSMALAPRLADREYAVSRYVLSRLSPGVRAQLSEYVTLREGCEDLPRSLMHDLNVSIGTRGIYSPERFKGIALPARTASLASENPSGRHLAELNRLLLQAAYPYEIAARPVDRVESRKGSALAVLLAMALSALVYLGAIKLMRVEEADFVWDMVKRRLTRRRNGDHSIADGPPG